MATAQHPVVSSSGQVLSCRAMGTMWGKCSFSLSAVGVSRSFHPLKWSSALGTRLWGGQRRSEGVTGFVAPTGSGSEEGGFN